MITFSSITDKGRSRVHLKTGGAKFTAEVKEEAVEDDAEGVNFLLAPPHMTRDEFCQWLDVV